MLGRTGSSNIDRVGAKTTCSAKYPGTVWRISIIGRIFVKAAELRLCCLWTEGRFEEACGFCWRIEGSTSEAETGESKRRINSGYLWIKDGDKLLVQMQLTSGCRNDSPPVLTSNIWPLDLRLTTHINSWSAALTRMRILHTSRFVSRKISKVTSTGNWAHPCHESPRTSVEEIGQPSDSLFLVNQDTINGKCESIWNGGIVGGVWHYGGQQTIVVDTVLCGYSISITIRNRILNRKSHFTANAKNSNVCRFPHFRLSLSVHEK